MKKKYSGALPLLLAVFLTATYVLTASAAAADSRGEPELSGSWRTITQDEAKRVMEEEPSCVILDVRTEEEYETGHIAGAVCIPVETIAGPPEALPDLGQTILVYCRSGRRSKQAAQKLADLGYTDIREFGGINDWTGGTVTAEDETDFLTLTGLTGMAAALNSGAVVEKAYFTEGYGFSDASFTTSDPGEIEALWSALRAIRLGEPSGMDITDWYPQIIFCFQDGRRFGARFEGRWLDKGGNYELENAEDFWSLTAALMDARGK